MLDGLKMILGGAPLNDVLAAITRLIEAHSTGMLCSIFLLDEDSLHLRYGVAASLPEAYRAATDGICIGPNVGSCGEAAYLRQPDVLQIRRRVLEGWCRVYCVHQVGSGSPSMASGKGTG